MKVDAALLADPDALADAILRLSASFEPLRRALEPLREAIADIGWMLIWYRDPGSAWWER